MRKLFVLAGLAAVVGLLALPGSGVSGNDSVVIPVPATATVHFAGQTQSDLEANYLPSSGWASVPWDVGGGGGCNNFHNDTADWVGVPRAGGDSPHGYSKVGTAVVPPYVEVCGDTLSITATGLWGHGPAHQSGPGGKGASDPTHGEYDDFGISLVVADLNTLIGVFLTDDPPDPGATPSSLTSPTTTPALQQAFPIGTSLANITIPAGATRLFFGLQDGYEWWNNGGSVDVTVSLNCVFVDIDIKPGSYPNSINLKSKGVTPVAILTNEDFDATTVDADTVRFGPAEAEKVHERAHVEDADGDGDLDLILHFRTQDTGIAPGDTEACLTGETFDGVPIVGCDSVRTVPVLEPLKIGLLVPYTGALSDFGAAFERSAKLAIKEINGAGGVLGSDVVLVTADSGTEPLKAQEEARRLIDIEKVSAIIGAAASGVTIPVAESVTVPAEILQISPSATSPALSSVQDNDYLFRTVLSDAPQGAVLAHLASDLSFTSACTMYVNNAYGQGLSEQFAEAFEELGGTVTAEVSHATEEQVSYLDELNQCVAGNPDVLAAISYPEHASVYLREALDEGLMDTFLFGNGTKSPDMFEELGWGNFEGMYGTVHGALETAAGTAFADAYEAEYGERPPLPFMEQTYDAVYVIALAAAKADSADSTAIRDALRDIANPPGEVVGPGVAGFEGALALIAASTDIDYSGASGPLDFDENGDVLHGAIEVWQITAGEIVEAVRTFEVDLSTTPPTVTEVTE